MVDFGWMLPTGRQRMPEADYTAHVQAVLATIEDAFHSFWIPDHLMDGSAPIPEALVTLAYLAGVSGQLHMGTCVLAQGFRNPALLAKMAASLQQLSGGRFIMGLGAGWKADEYHAYGYAFPDAATRIAQMGEAAAICKQLWQGVPVTYRGQHHVVEEAVCVPVPHPPPPIMIGGVGEKRTLPMVAQHADWWNIPGAPVEVVMQKSAVLARHCAARGRNPADIRRTWMGVVSIAPTSAQAQAQLAGYPIWEGDQALVGTPEAIIQQIERYVAAGISLFILSFVDEPEMRGLHLFREAVILRGI